MRFNKILLLTAALLVAFSCDKDPEPTPKPDPVIDPIDPVDPETDDYFAYGIADISITTDGGAEVDVTKDGGHKPEYVGCSVEVDGNGIFADHSGHGKIRGRGNSSLRWYPKKPYRIKLDESSEFLGMLSNRDWVLLADYRDVTHLMNNTGFAMAHYLGLPYTNHSRYARVTLNGEYMGLYVVTEQVEEGGHRVDIDKESGLLVALDVNDGPEDEPDATDNFWSEVYGMACCVKYPDGAGPAEVAVAKSALAELEESIEGKDWDEVTKVLDVESMAKYILVQEIMANVEMNNGESIRSGYISRKDPESKWILGPVWDCDGAYGYSWHDMYDSKGEGHNYFADYERLIFGSDPLRQRGAYGSYPEFFSDMFMYKDFVSLTKDTWNDNKDGMLESLLDNIDKTEVAIADASQEDLDLWGIRYSHSGNVKQLRNWLVSRFSYLDTVINSYPSGTL